MRSTMMATPLQVSRILEHGSTVHSGAQVITWTGAESGPRRMSFGEVGARAAQLAHALRDELGITGDQRVATFMWNNAEHLIAYFAVPSMGAVLHTLNLRLFPEQLIYVATHAEDRVIIADSTLIAPLAEVERVRVHRWEELLAGKPETYEWPVVDENDAAALCYTSGTTGNPKGVAYSHRSIWLHSMEICMSETFALGPKDLDIAIVPMFHAMAWGLVYAAFMGGCSLLMPDRFLQPEPIAKMIEAEKPTVGGAVPTIWTALLD